MRPRSSAVGVGSPVALGVGDSPSSVPPVQPRPLRPRSSAVKVASPSCPGSALADAEAIVEKLTPAPDADPEGAVVNAFWQRSELCLIVRDSAKPSGVRIRRTRAEHSFFITELDGRKLFPGSKKPLSDVLKGLRQVVKMTAEGDWWRVCVGSRDQCKDLCTKLEGNGINTFEGCVSPVMRHMVDNHVPIANPRKAWLDLETDSRVTFIKAEEDARILCWCLYGEDGELIAEALLEEDTDDAERRLLQKFVDAIQCYDLIAAWNGDRFDFKVLKRRLEQRGIKIEWRRWQWLDYMVLFQRMNVASESGDEKQSFKLDVITHTLLGVGKHTFDASKTWDAYITTPCSDLTCMACRGCLLKYCRQDTRLMSLLEEKTGFMQLLRTLAEACGTFADTRGINPTVQVEGFLQRLALRTGYKFPTVLSLSYGEKYDGAYVMTPTCYGITKNVHVADFASLYPAIIVTWNMSPETRVKRKADEAGGDEDPTPDELRFAQQSWSPLTDVYFTTDKPGILPAAVQELMQLRKHWNKLKASLPPGSPAWKDADRKSTAYKVAANSFYGVIGSPMSRFFDRNVAESVAQAGKWLILKAVQEANRHGMDVVYADTDSVFVHGATRTEFELFVEECNDELWPRVLKEVGCPENLIDLAYEKQFERLIFGFDPKKKMLTMKKYIGRYVHYKGTLADPKTSKPEIKGFEYKRGDSVKFARNMQEEVINMLVGYGPEGGCEDPDKFEVVLDRWKNQILRDPLTLDDVMIGKRLQKPLEKYVRKPLKNGPGFAKQLPHIEIARMMEARGEDVGEGVRIEYFILDGGCSPMDCRQATEWDHPAPGHPPGTTLGTTIDRYVIWDRQVFPPTLRLLAGAFPGHDWTPWARTRPKKVRKPRVRKVT